MRLSNAQTSLLHLFLIISLTLLLNPDAKGQDTSFAKVFAYNSRHNHPLFDKTRGDYNEMETDIYSGDSGLTAAQTLAPFYFHRVVKKLYPAKSAYQVIQSNFKVCPPHRVILARVYSIDLNHSARVTFKLVKLVIVPLWYSK